jgi:hypothetical protein
VRVKWTKRQRGRLLQLAGLSSTVQEKERSDRLRTTKLQVSVNWFRQINAHITTHSPDIKQFKEISVFLPMFMFEWPRVISSSSGAIVAVSSGTSRPSSAANDTA